VSILVFGRSGCARTRRVLLRLERMVKEVGWSDRVRLEFFDLETAEGLAEAAFQQLEGEIPTVLVDIPASGPAISGETSFRGRRIQERGEAHVLRIQPSLN